jgi:lipopolysaccharide export system protein LptA
VVIWQNGNYVNNKNAKLVIDSSAKRFEFKVANGNWKLTGKHTL